MIGMKGQVLLVIPLMLNVSRSGIAFSISRIFMEIPVYCSKSGKEPCEADQGTDNCDSSESVDLIIKAVFFHYHFPPR